MDTVQASPCRNGGDVMKNIGLVITSLVLAAGCSEHRYEFGGVSYCIPSQYLLPSPSIVPNGHLRDEGRGFALKGCWLPAKDPLAGCVFPREVITLGITQRENAPTMLRDEFGPGSFVDDFMRSPHLVSTPLPDGIVETTVAQHPDRHYFWTTDGTSTGTVVDAGEISSQVLVATCEGRASPDFPKWCKRTTMEGSFALSYSFRSEGLSRESVEDLDTRIVEGLTRLHCQG